MTVEQPVTRAEAQSSLRAQRFSGPSSLVPSPSLLFVLAAYFSLCLHAQQPAPSALDLAQRVDQHYNHLHSLQASFAESYQGMGVERSERGTLSLLKPGRMRWDYASPSGKVFLLDGKYAWFYTRGDPQVQRMQSKQLDDLRSPLRFLLGHTQLAKEMTHLTLAAAPSGEYTLTGQPKGQEARVVRLSLTVTPSGTITAIDIEETDGAETHFSFTGEQPDAPIPTGDFHFTPPPGVAVVDAQPPI
jgi:outer membrane lipoprotein carrier protein